MKNSLYFKQKKPIIAPILGFMLLLISIMDLFGGKIIYTKILVLLFISALLFSYSISYQITMEFRNWRHFKLFGFSLFKRKLLIEIPEYIAVFSAINKRSAEWGPVAAIGKNQLSDSFVIRLFSGRKHFTVYRTKSLSDAKLKAMELSELLGVKLKK